VLHASRRRVLADLLRLVDVLVLTSPDST